MRVAVICECGGELNRRRYALRAHSIEKHTFEPSVGNVRSLPRARPGRESSPIWSAATCRRIVIRDPARPNKAVTGYRTPKVRTRAPLLVSFGAS
jgi:hypothetical protein